MTTQRANPIFPLTSFSKERSKLCNVIAADFFRILNGKKNEVTGVLKLSVCVDTKKAK
jgi:hypothetical protein